MSDNSLARGELLTYLPGTEEAKLAFLKSFSSDIAQIVQVDDLQLFDLLVRTFVQPRDFKKFNPFMENLLAQNDVEKYKIVQQLFPKSSNYFVHYFGADLEELRLKALARLSQGKKRCRIYLTHYDNLEEVLRHGFVPALAIYKQAWILLDHLQVPIPTLSYLYNKDFSVPMRLFEMLNEAGLRNQYKRYSETTSIFAWTYPHLLYQTKRLKTDMAMFRTPFSNLGSFLDQQLIVQEQAYTELLPKQEEPKEFYDNYFLPVIRYAGSLDTGLYHKTSKKDICGTFYYYEPESTTFLLGKRILVVQTKYAALRYLLAQFMSVQRLQEKNPTIKLSLDLYQSKKNLTWEAGEFAPDLLYTPLELNNLHFFVPHKSRVDYRAEEVPQIAVYAGKLLKLYAAEDGFDQPLCLAAKTAGFDLIVLTRMVGSKQIVTEVLDARSREDSFKSLVYTT